MEKKPEKKAGRKPNIVRVIPLTISTTSLNVKYLEQLVRKGQKGKNATDAAERVLSDHIEQLIRAGELKTIEPTSEDLTAAEEEQQE